ncbi:MAG: class I SAM-dependent methyltransferase [Woeseia sp.]
MNESRKSHWQRVYASKEPTEVSWYQPIPAKSLSLIRSTGVSPTAPMSDVGGGASTLVDHLLDAGYRDISVLDIAVEALDKARERLANRAAQVTWIEADVTEFEPTRFYEVWHDRAVFHFLTESTDRELYLSVLRRALQSRGHFLLATFGPDGPNRCSGLEVQRYSIEQVGALLGQYFRLRAHEIEEHHTPIGIRQQFLYGWWQFEA